MTLPLLGTKLPRKRTKSNCQLLEVGGARDWYLGDLCLEHHAKGTKQKTAALAPKRVTDKKVNAAPRSLPVLVVFVPPRPAFSVPFWSRASLDDRLHPRRRRARPRHRCHRHCCPSPFCPVNKIQKRGVTHTQNDSKYNVGGQHVLKNKTSMSHVCMCVPT